MMPGINPKKMKQMMKQLGMKMEQLEDVSEVVISTAAGNYIFERPEVVATTMQGVTSYQITGEPRFEPAEVEIPQGDVMLVAEQTGVSEDAAKNALKKTNGDIAEAILLLTGS
ncbi:MAG: nascent polypeptide-associated complex protein [Methanomicrobiaceae archaeon]|nr:nascent polypeptide-associated complex protein [Methanomicrobiaceae archaeon]